MTYTKEQINSKAFEDALIITCTSEYGVTLHLKSPIALQPKSPT